MSTPETSGYATPAYSGSDTSYGQPEKKTLSLVSLILGISSIVIPIFINGVAAIVLGVLGRKRENAKGLALGGIITGAVGILASLITLGIIIASFAALASLGDYAATYSTY